MSEVTTMSKHDTTSSYVLVVMLEKHFPKNSEGEYFSWNQVNQNSSMLVRVYATDEE